MTWNLDFNRDPKRMAILAELDAQSPQPRWDGTGPPPTEATGPRVVLAGAKFAGGPGREREAAEAWAFEMKTYFKRGVGERPEVAYSGGVYAVVGLITTTHPHDRPKEDGIVWFT